jgi:hypothetical protein
MISPHLARGVFLCLAEGNALMRQDLIAKKAATFPVYDHRRTRDANRFYLSPEIRLPCLRQHVAGRDFLHTREYCVQEASVSKVR